jgi:hypothetical protein
LEESHAALNSRDAFDHVRSRDSHEFGFGVAARAANALRRNEIVVIGALPPPIPIMGARRHAMRRKDGT